MDPFGKAPAPVQGIVVVSAAASPSDLGELKLPLLCRLAAAAALLAAMLSLPACGGGGGAAPTPPAPPPPAPSPAPTAATPIAAQLTVPAPVGYDAERLAAFNRLNEIRLSAGLGMLAQNVLMDRAAQAHAEWMVANDSFTHEEVAGTPGFTGVSWPLRDEAFGYVPVEGAEVIAGGAHGAASVDVLVNTAYHRAALLAFESVDVGIGWTGGSTVNVSMPLVVDLTRPGTDTVRGQGQLSQASIDGIEIWPLSRALDVPLRLGLESPNPVPTQEVVTLGTPASITVEKFKTIYTTSFALTNTMTGSVVPTHILTSQNDSNFLVPESFVAVIPLAPLSPGTTYSASFSGYTTQFPSGNTAAVNRTWSFTTAAQ